MYARGMAATPDIIRGRTLFSEKPRLASIKTSALRKMLVTESYGNGSRRFHYEQEQGK